MPKFPITIKQTYRVVRTTVVEVEADDREGACRLANFGEVDLPEWSDERWKDDWSLTHEEAS
jgi:hypothetical protein